jgi:hypothetical protein
VKARRSASPAVEPGRRAAEDELAAAVGAREQLEALAAEDPRERPHREQEPLLGR